MNQKVSVTGLQNIGKLMERNAAAIAKPAEKVDVLRAIVDKTIPGIMDMSRAHRNVNDADTTRKSIEARIAAAVREAFNAGHGEAFAQSQVVDAMLDKQYKARTNLTMPAVVAAVMEQTGMHKLSMTLEGVATVFDRCKIEYHVAQATTDVPVDIIHYTLDILPTASDRAVEGP